MLYKIIGSRLLLAPRKNIYLIQLMIYGSFFLLVLIILLLSKKYCIGKIYVDDNYNQLFNDKLHEIVNITFQITFRNETLEINNPSLLGLSGEYEELKNSSMIDNGRHHYDIEELYFALTTSPQRIRNMSISFLQFWAQYPGLNCLIVFQEMDFRNDKSILQYLKSMGIPCAVTESSTKRYEERYFELFYTAWNSPMNNGKNGKKLVQWFAVGDDDTVWFIDNLLFALRQYNSSDPIYLGDISYAKLNANFFGRYFAYGGGGVLLSRPLASLYAKHLPLCHSFRSMFGGDGMIGKCVIKISKVTLTRNQNFHQNDDTGDMTGFMESGIDRLVSLHHLMSWWYPFPKQHSSRVNETMQILRLGYSTFRQHIFKRYVRFDYETNRTLLLTLGYSFSIFNRILSNIELFQVENTWGNRCNSDRQLRPKERIKMTSYFRNLTNISTHDSVTYEMLFQQYKRRSRNG